MVAPVVMSEDTSSLASQCLAFCQGLASQGQALVFKLKVCNDFNFFLDSQLKKPAPKARKKPSPSTKNRNERRRQEFLALKEAPKTSKIPSEEEAKESKASKSSNISVSCDQCGHKTKTENGMKLHKKNKHEVQQIDGNSSLSELHSEVPVCENKETQTVEDEHMCEQCEFKSNSKSDMDKHLASKHVEKPKCKSVQTEDLKVKESEVIVKWGGNNFLTLPPGTVVLRYEAGSYEESKVKQFPLDYPVMSSPAPMVFHPVWGLGKFLDNDDEHIFYKFNDDEEHTGGIIKT